MPNSPEGHSTALGRVLSIAVYDFLGAFSQLPFTDPVNRLRTALRTIGFDVEPLDGPTAQELGQAVWTFLEAPGDGVRIVHVMSHGRVATTGVVYVVGADGQSHKSTKAGDWPEELEADPDRYGRRHTLFVLDFCFSGTVAWPAWVSRLPAHLRRSWVIAATEPGKSAYNAWLTTAFADLVDRVSSRKAAAGLRLDPAEPYVPFEVLVDEIRDTVWALAGETAQVDQRVVASPAEGRYPRLPFLPNPRRTPPDFVYWAEPTGGKHRDASDEGSGPGFIGRKGQLDELAAWLGATQNPAAAPVAGLRVVTGGRGSGKTALLGILVIAAHHDYAAIGDELWQAALAGNAPSRFARGQFAAAQARRNDLRAVTRQLIDQLRPAGGLTGEVSGREAARVLGEVFAGYADPPLIVLDAVDEAADPVQLLTELILPLSRARDDGRPLAYCLVGIRKDESPFELLAGTMGHTGILDLDEIDPETLRAELSEYIKIVLRKDSVYGGVTYTQGRADFAYEVANKLACRDPGDRGGEFLIASLYVHHVITCDGPPFRGLSPVDCGQGVPVDPHDVLEMDLDTAASRRPLRRSVLAALAHAWGSWMPLSVVHAVALLWSAPGSVPSQQDVETVLDAEALYVQTRVAPDGSTLYRLHAAGVEEHLRAHPCSKSETADGAAGVLDAVLDSLGKHDTVRRPWHRATPYVAQHAAGHAVRENRLADLLQEPGYLIHADADLLRPLLVDTCAAHGSAALLRGTPPAVLRRLGYGERRHLLALEAARWDQRSLALDILETEARDAPPNRVTPLWATASTLDPRQLAVFRGHDAAVNTVLHVWCAGHPVAISAGADGAIRFSDPVTGLETHAPLIDHTAEITALTVSRHRGTVRLSSASADQTIRQWDLGATANKPAHGLFAAPATGPAAVLRGHTAPVTGLAAFRHRRKSLIASGSADGTIRLWDPKTGRSKVWTGHSDTVTCLAVFVHGDETLIASGCADGTIGIWDLRSEKLRATLAGHTDTITCLTVFTDGGRTFVASGSSDTTVGVWDVAALGLIGEPRRGHSGRVTAITVLPASPAATLVSADSGGGLYEWRADLSPADGLELRGHHGEITAIHAAGRVLLTGGADASVRTWSRRPVTPWRPAARGHRGPVSHLTSLDLDGAPVCVSASGASASDLAAGVSAADRSLRFWTLVEEKPELLGEVALGTPPTALAALADGTVAVGTADGRLGRVRLADRSFSWKSDCHDETVIHAATAVVDGVELLITVGAEGVVRRWSPAGEGFAEYGEAFDLGRGAFVAATGAIEDVPVIVIAGSDRALTIWDLATGARYDDGALPLRTEDLTALAFVDVGGEAHVLAGLRDGTVRLWNLRTLSDAGVLGRHRGAVVGLAGKSVDGVATVVSVGEDRQAIVWDVASGRDVERVALPESGQCAHWSRGGQLVVGFGRDVAVFDASDVYDGDGDF